MALIALTSNVTVATRCSGDEPRRGDRQIQRPTKLLSDAREQVPRLRFELTEVGLRKFLLNAERIGVVCTKYRNSAANGWTFAPLSECREAWERLYGALRWDNDAKDWA